MNDQKIGWCIMTGSANGIASKPRRVAHSNVLIVEDNWDTAETIWLTLAHAGYGARAVHSRDEALDVLEHRYIYDAIILDLNMPGITAAQFVKTVRQVYPRIHIILITASNEAARAAKSLGVHHWIGKPFLPDDVLECLHSMDL